jgi:hypothetical protein
MRQYAFLLALLGASAWAQCSEPFYPARPGMSWEYQVESAQPARVHLVVNRVSSHGFVVTQTTQFQGTTVKIHLHWSCTPQGLVSPDFFSGSVSIPKLTGAFKSTLVRYNGVIFPPAALWKPGYSWSYHFVIRETSTESVPNSPSVQVQVDETVTNTIIGPAKVQVPAGTYQALEVKSAYRVLTTEELPNGMSYATPPIQDTATSYYVQGIGLVLQVTPQTREELLHFTP